MNKHPEYFQFKQFKVYHDQCALKVGTDGVLLGAWSHVSTNLKDQNTPHSILDIGCGTGLISLMLAQRYPNAHITGIDIDPWAVIQARTNAALSPWNNQILFITEDAVSFAAQYSTRERFDTIVSNPPFYEENLMPNTSCKTRAKHTVSLPLIDLINTVTNLLKPKTGLFNVILPTSTAYKFITEAESHNLHLIHLTRVCTVAQRPPKRLLLCFKYDIASPLSTSIDTLPLSGNKSHGRSEEYELLTQNFYL